MRLPEILSIQIFSAQIDRAGAACRQQCVNQGIPCDVQDENQNQECSGNRGRNFFRQNRGEDAAEKTTEILFDEPVVLLASPEDAINEKTPVYPKDLDHADMILTEDGSYRSVFEDMLTTANVRPASFVESASIEAIKKLVVSGLGVTLLPRVVALAELQAGQLVDPGWNGPDFEIKSQMIRHKDKWLSPALQAMLEMARRHAMQRSARLFTYGIAPREGV